MNSYILNYIYKFLNRTNLKTVTNIRLLSAFICCILFFNYSYSQQESITNSCTDGTNVLEIQAFVNTNYNGSDLTCNGASNGEVCVSVLTGTGNYVFTWIDPFGTGTNINTTCISGLDAGDYWIIVQDVGVSPTLVCQINNITITDPNPVTVFNPFDPNDPFVITPPICADSCNGLASGQWVTGGTPGSSGYTYVWGNGDLTMNTSAICTGNNTLTASDANGCSFDTTIILNLPTNIFPNVSVTDLNCFGICDGELESNPTGGNGVPYTYSWEDNSSTVIGINSIVSGLCDGTYSVTVTDDFGCIDDTVVVITTPIEIIPVVTLSSDATCSYLCDGSTTISISGGTPPYVSTEWFEGSPGSGVSTGLFGLTINSLCAGIDYYVEITDNNGCVINFPIPQVSSPPPITISASITDVDCNGNGNGVIDVTLSGGTPTLTPFWSVVTPGAGLLPNSEDQSTLSGGTYQLLVTDNNGCVDSIEYTVDEPDTIISNGVVTDITCYDQIDGIIDLSIIGGQTPYTSISWSSSNPSFVDPGTEDLSGLDSGSYSITVIDANGCIYDTTLIITKPSEIFADGSFTDVVCFGDADGTISLNTNSGAGGYSWSWTGPGGFSSPDENLTGLDIGTYDVTITDINGCTKDTSLTINEPDDILITLDLLQNVDCNGNGNGVIDVTLSGGTPTLTPFWSVVTPGAGLLPNSEDQSTLSGGTYQLLVTDNNGCVDSIEYTVDEPDTIISNGVVTDITCYDQIDGIIDLSIIGGQTPYTSISWSSSNPSFVDPGTEDLSGLDSGSYSITVIDANGCIYDTTLIITKPSEIFADGSFTDVVCFGDADGTISLNTNSGAGGYSWSWTGPGGFSSPDENLTGLDIGTYDVTITDINGCTKDTSLTINEPDDILITLDLLQNVDCNGNGNGVIDVTLSGGTPTLTPFWSVVTPGAGLLPNSEDQSTLSGGTYQLLVTDNNGCVDSIEYTVDEPDTIISNGVVTDITCYDQIDGIIDLSIIGGQTPYTSISWSSSNPSFVDPGTEDLSGLDSGSYSITVIDANGCIYDTTLIITKPSEIFADGSFTDVVCFGDADGTISLNTNSGAGGYSWSWTGPGGFSSPDENLTGLDIGTYDVTITDINGCTKDTSLNINEPDDILFSGSHTDVVCFGEDNGTILFSASGGSPQLNWTWSSTNTGFTSPGGNATSITGLGPGTYTVQLLDANGCVKDTSFIILEPDEIIANGIVTDLTCNNNNSGEINISPTGGSGGFTFDWDNDGTGDNDDNEDLSGLAVGTYCLGLIDSNQPLCRLDTCFDIIEPDEIFANLVSVTEISCADSLNGSIDIAPSGGTVTGVYTYDWDNDGTGDNDDSEDISTIGSGIYCVSIIDDNSCSTDTCITITALDPIVFNPIIDSSSCSLANGNINLTITGGNTPLLFDWDNDGLGDNDDSEDLLGLFEGDYQLFVSYTGNDGTLCSVDTTFNIVDNPPSPTASFVVVDESCFGSCDGSITTTINSGANPITFVWSSTNVGFVNDGAQNQFNLCSGDYYLSLTDGNGCSIADTFAITSSDQLTVSEIITNVDCSGDSTGEISITVTGGNISTTGAYDFSWVGLGSGYTSTSEDINNLISDSYQLIVSDDDGCSDSLVYDVTQNTALNLSTSAVDATCADSNGSVSVTATGGIVALDYVYNWLDQNGISIGITTNVNNLSAGTYTVLVTDDLGCLDSATTTVNDLSTSTITIDTVINESCAGDNDGLITVSLTISPPPGVLSWTGPAGFVDPGGVNTTISSLAAGQYIATLIDGLGCQQQEVIDIVAAQALSLNNLVVDPLCFNENSGSIDIFPSGGSVATDYTYDWDNDGTGDNDDSQNLSALVAGTYIVNVVDDNGCSIQDTFNLANPSELIGSTNASFAACGSNDGFVTVTSSGGTIGVDYTYLWLDQATGLQVGNTDSVANLTAGCYDITVTDDNACFFNAVVCISNPTGPTIALDQIDSVTCFGGSDGSIFVTVTGANIPFVYDWQNVTPPHPNNLEDLINLFSWNLLINGY